jgi:gamma-glutamyl hydrolase
VSLPDPANQKIINTTNVMGLYVEWIRAAGGDAIAIHSWMSDSEIEEIFTKVNGFLFQGGGRNLDLNGEFEVFSNKIINKVIEYKDKKNITIPLWGTCQGFELIHMLVANSYLLDKFDADNILTPLVFDDSIIRKSRMFSLFNEADFSSLKNLNTTAHFHHFGVSESTFNKYQTLKTMFQITSYGKDRNNDLAIASIEAFNYPIYAVQFHPEKSPRDTNPNNLVATSDEAIRINLNLGLFLIDEAKKNQNRLKIEERVNYDFIDTYSVKWVNKSGNYFTYYNKNDKKKNEKINLLEIEITKKYLRGNEEETKKGK